MQSNNLAEKTVVLGADHNGVVLKSEVKKFLKDLGFICIDLGPHNDHEKVDYVDYAKILGHIINNGEARWGVLMCGTGVGMSIVANRFPNVRASLVHKLDVASKTREHNDANVICLGAWVNSIDDNLKIIEAWFATPFGEGRHVSRVEKTKESDRTKIVFTNGVFDILHRGHIQLLKFAKSLGGKLIVAINSDRTVKILKGEDRPINKASDRKAALENFHFVDQVIIFDDPKPTTIISQIRPDIVVKGAEWTVDEVRLRDNIPPEIEVKVFPLAAEPSGAKYSTTGFLEKIKSQNSNHV